MADRTDIDALLIGALYGELEPADEARLTAHLESHPADRTALGDLTRTRAAVQESRILAAQQEPPQAISALLLQEAARRAPRPATQGRDGASWFQRFVRSFVAHPAMAAAATIVLVLGVSGTLYLRGVKQFAEPAPPSLRPEPAATAPATVATTTAAAEPQAVPQQAAAAPEPAEIAAGSAAVGAGSAGALAAAEGGEPPSGGPAKADDREGRLEKNKGGDNKAGYRVDLDDQAKDVAFAKPVKPARREDAPVMTAKSEAKSASRTRGIELRPPELAPKDLEESSDKPEPTRRYAPPARKPSGSVAMRKESADERVTQQAQSAPGAAGGAPAAAAPPPPAAPSAVASAAPGAAAPAGQPKLEAAPAPARKKAAPSRDEAAASGESSAFDESRAADGKLAEPSSGRDKALLAWASRQREQVIALVSANRCADAARAAVAIYNRAPAFYASSVATDRAVRPCLVYVNREREREDRSRAAKNANSTESPAQATPPARK